MLKARKRITKRKVKEDKFVTYYFKTVDFVKQHSKKVMMGLIAVAAIIVLIVFFVRSKRTAELNASEQLAKANSEIASGELQMAIDILLSMSDNYSGTNSASKGVYLLAYTFFQKGDYESALTYFRKYLDDYADDPILTSAAYSGIGACLEQQGKFLEAAQSYEKGATKSVDHYNAPQQLMDAGRCYTLVNRIADARNCYEMVMENYPESGFKNDAQLFLARIKG
ncbi:MAG: tetratricopeptide repeat protein [bacterium]|nr:MAG: tetratricopeptide repeat protein [bacterium]